jgi:hypothetical protein
VKCRRNVETFVLVSAVVSALDTGLATGVGGVGKPRG